MIDTNQALQALLQAGQSKVSQFSPTSRYYGIETVTMDLQDGRTVIFLRRRFIPSPENFALLQRHVVTQDERLDNIAAKYFHDPELFWRLCDANGAMQPEELTEIVGHELRITLPVGIPGVSNA